MSTQPSFADLPSPPTPINKDWSDAAAKERIWFALQMFALGLLFVAVLTWPRTTPNMFVEAALCVLAGYASVRHGRCSRRRARLSPRPSPPSSPPPATAPRRPSPPAKAAGG
jgi:hypothetical protein